MGLNVSYNRHGMVLEIIKMANQSRQQEKNTNHGFILNNPSSHFGFVL